MEERTAEDVRVLRAEITSRRNLPTLPTVLARVLQLVESERASGRELVEVVEHDQALTAKVLRLANSAFFGQEGRVATVPRALVLLGFSTVRNLALGVQVWDALATGVARERSAELWAHAVAVAVAAKALAARSGAADPDEAFTAGLLHDAGRLVLAMRFGDDYWRAVGGAEEAAAVEQQETGAFGVDHAEVGSWMLEAWGLPTGIVDGVRHHHPAVPGTGPAWLLAVADRLVAWTDLATGVPGPEAALLLEQTTERGITPERWAAAVEQIGNSRALAGIGG